MAVDQFPHATHSSEQHVHDFLTAALRQAQENCACEVQNPLGCDSTASPPSQKPSADTGRGETRTHSTTATHATPNTRIAEQNQTYQWYQPKQCPLPHLYIQPHPNPLSKIPSPKPSTPNTPLISHSSSPFPPITARRHPTHPTPPSPAHAPSPHSPYASPPATHSTPSRSPPRPQAQN